MSRAVADPADLDDPEKYTALPEAEVFDEHVRWKLGKDGRPTKEVAFRFDRAWLERYAAGCNQREADGSFCSMTIGHTIDGAPEKDQPETIGAWRKHRVAWSPVKNRWVMMATPYVQKGREAEAKSYPKVSIEAWRHMPVIDPIAILRRTPERPTQWTYAAAGDRWRFSMEDAGVDPLDPTAPPDAAAPDDDFTRKFSACMASMYPRLQAMHEKFAAECGGETKPGEEMTAPTPKPAEPTPVPPADRERFSAIEAENKALKDRFSAVEAANAGLEKKLRERERRTDLEGLALRFEMNVDEELADCADLPAEKYAAHLKRIQRYVPKAVDPAGGPVIDTTGPATGADKFAADATTSAKAEAYQRKHHDRLQRFSAEERAERAWKFATTGKEE